MQGLAAKPRGDLHKDNEEATRAMHCPLPVHSIFSRHSSDSSLLHCCTVRELFCATCQPKHRQRVVVSLLIFFLLLLKVPSLFFACITSLKINKISYTWSGKLAETGSQRCFFFFFSALSGARSMPKLLRRKLNHKPAKNWPETIGGLLYFFSSSYGQNPSPPPSVRARSTLASPISFYR